MRMKRTAQKKEELNDAAAVETSPYSQRQAIAVKRIFSILLPFKNQIAHTQMGCFGRF